MVISSNKKKNLNFEPDHLNSLKFQKQIWRISITWDKCHACISTGKGLNKQCKDLWLVHSLTMMPAMRNSSNSRATTMLLMLGWELVAVLKSLSKKPSFRSTFGHTSCRMVSFSKATQRLERSSPAEVWPTAPLVASFTFKISEENSK